MRRFARASTASTVLACSLLSSCSFLIAREPPVPTDGVNPFSLEVQSELNDGRTLTVIPAITGTVPWDPRLVMVQLVALRDGEEIGRSESFLGSAVKDEVVAPGVKIPVSLAVEAENLTDYQVELVWGREVEQRLAISTTPLSLGLTLPKLELIDVRIDEMVSCEASPCTKRFRLIAEMRNSGSVPVSSATLGTGYLWIPKGTDLNSSSLQIPESEELLELSNLSLPPGSSRPLDIELSGSVPETPDGQFRPVLRIVRAS